MEGTVKGKPQRARRRHGGPQSFLRVYDGGKEMDSKKMNHRGGTGKMEGTVKGKPRRARRRHRGRRSFWRSYEEGKEMQGKR
jgi:hypothetical protein